MSFSNWLGQGSSRRRRGGRDSSRKLHLEELESRQLLSVNVLTWHNDLTRQGLNSAETALTPANVNSSSFGKLFTYAVAQPVSGGGQIYAEPLYVSNLAIPGQGTHNVVFVATENNDVYAFDADSNAGPNGGVLWHVNLGPAAATPPPNNNFGSRYGPYSDIKPQVGITSTPVIDLATGTMYLDSFTNDVVGQNVYSHHIWALNITTGLEMTTPALVAASMQGNGVDNVGGTISFKASQQLQRSALTLLNGTIYVAYAGYADTDPYHGWVLGFNASTLQLTSVLNTTPNHPSPADPFQSEEGGIWQSGNGFTSDGARLYVMTGNGDFQTNIGDYGDSFLEITPDNSTQPTNKNGYGLSVTDYFTPFNEQSLANADTDLGSGGTMILPDQPGPHPHLLVGSGKQGVIYVIDRDNMGQFNVSTDNVVQKVNLSHGTWSSPAYFNNMIYEHASGDVLKAFGLANGVLSVAPVALGSTTYSYPGATPSISSNGNANGIVWDVQYDATHAVLRAYNAIPTGTSLTQLFNSNQNVARDQLGAGVKFVTPMIANGHVYVGTTGGLAVFGLLSPPNTAPAAPSNLTATVPAALQIKLNWTDNANSEGWFKIERSTDDVSYSQIDVASANATSYVDTTAVPGTTYFYRVRAANIAGDSAYAGPASATAIAISIPLNLYHFDEGMGTTAADSAGSNTGMLVGTTKPAWVAGRIGAGALSFSGDGLFNQTNEPAVQVTNNLATTLGATSTLDVWVKTTQIGSSIHGQAPAITGVDQSGGTSDINWGTLNASGRIGIYVGDIGGIYSTNPINDGQWHNVAMTRDSTTGIVQLYVDGVLNGTGAFDIGIKSSQFFLIGALSDVASNGTTLTGANYFNGQLDEVRIYNRVLTPTEIAEIGQIPAAPTGLMATPIPDSGSMVQLSWTNVSGFAQNVEVQRTIGAGGIYQQIALLNGSATGYTDINLDAGTQYFYQVRAVDLAGSSAFSNEASATPPRPQIVSRFTFYNRSFWDGQNGSSNIADNLAIATDKQALLPGQTATFQNYTSYSNGMNGIIIDVRNFEGVISQDDFTLLVGKSSDTGTWQPAPDPEFIAMYPGFGVGGTTRFELLWEDNAIQNEWVQVTLKADAVTKLAAPDVFYFGNAIGESGNSASTAVDTGDELAARSNGTAAGAASITNLYDYNRDKQVDQQDELIARSHRSGLYPLQLIAAPAGAGAGAAVNVDAAPSEVPTVAVTVSSLSAAPAPFSSAPNPERATLLDAALSVMYLPPGAVRTHPFSPLTSAALQSNRASRIDQALLAATLSSASSSVSGSIHLIGAAWHDARDETSDAASSVCDHSDVAAHVALATNLRAERFWRHRGLNGRGGA